MIDQPRMVETAAAHAAVVHLEIPRAEIRSAIGAARAELTAVLTAQGVAPASPWFSHHLRLEPMLFDFEIGVAVASPIRAAGRVESRVQPAARFATAIHRGGYEGLNRAWEELDDWIVAQGGVPAVDLWEIYLVGPPSHPDPATWQTQLQRAALR